MTRAAGDGGRTIVIGIGNEFRRDDGAGPAVIERLRGKVPAGVDLAVSDGDPVRLIEMWSGASLAVVVDAVRAEPASPGRMHRFVLGGSGPGQAPGGFGWSSPQGDGTAGPRAAQSASTHGLGLDEAIGLGIALDRMPDRLIVHAIEAADTTQGTGMTPAVSAAVAEAVGAIRHDLLASG